MYTFFKKKTIAYHEGYEESLLKMETHTMFLFGKTQFQDMSISQNLMSKFNVIPIKIPPGFLCNLRNWLKCKSKYLKISQKILKKNEQGGGTYSFFFNFFNFIFWLRWVFVAARRLSLVAASGLLFVVVRGCLIVVASLCFGARALGARAQ